MTINLSVYVEMQWILVCGCGLVQYYWHNKG